MAPRTVLKLALCLACGVVACDNSTSTSDVDAGTSGQGGALPAVGGSAGAGGAGAGTAGNANGGGGYGAMPPDGAAGDASSGGGAGWTGFPCPLQGPAAGSVCAVEGAICGYDPPSLDVNCSDCAPCREVFDCTAGHWVQRPKGDCGVAANPVCPASEPQTGTSCPQANVACRYETRLCYCAQCETAQNCKPGDPAKWYCVGPPPVGCPSFLPTSGEACATVGQICDDYELCFPFSAWTTASWAVCENGSFSIAHGDCGP